jgi:hypothetical protein
MLPARVPPSAALTLDGTTRRYSPCVVQANGGHRRSRTHLARTLALPSQTLDGTRISPQGFVYPSLTGFTMASTRGAGGGAGAGTGMRGGGGGSAAAAASPFSAAAAFRTGPDAEGVTDIFSDFLYGPAASSSSRNATGVIDSVIHKRAFKLVGAAPMDAFVAVPADNRRSSVATVAVQGRFAYVQVRGMPNGDPKAMRRQPFAHATFFVDVATRARFVYRLAFSTAYTAWDLKLGKIAEIPLPPYVPPLLLLFSWPRAGR